MKLSILLLLMLSSSIAIAQKLEKSKDNGYYEFATVINYENSNLLEAVKNKLLKLNYEIKLTTDSIISASRTISMGLLTGQEVTYDAKIQTRANRYKLTFTNFLITIKTDQGGKNTNAIEKMGWPLVGMWVKTLNKKIPQFTSELDLNTAASEKKDTW